MRYRLPVRGDRNLFAAVQHFAIPAKIPPPEDPEVVASLVSYLAKPEAYFITGKKSNSRDACEDTYLPQSLQRGQTITVDGGIVFD